MMKGKFSQIFILASAIFLGWATPGFTGTILFQEDFEDANFSNRGWYDNTTLKLSNVEHVVDSTKSLELHFAEGAITADNNGTAMRKKFQETDSLYIRYYVKHSESWVGSGVPYHPHMFHIMTNKETDWANPADTHLTLYLEELGGKPQILIQDALNIDYSNIGKNLTGISEKRAVAGCNGDSDGYGDGDCYANGSYYRNVKTMWKANTDLFSNVQGPFYKGDWHLVEAYVKMNSIVNGVAVKDGILQYWFDGKPIVSKIDMVYRTGQYPDMKFSQFLIGTQIGIGSPVDQTLWIDNLVIGTERTGQSKLSSPKNLRIISQ